MSGARSDRSHAAIVSIGYSQDKSGRAGSYVKEATFRIGGVGWSNRILGFRHRRLLPRQWIRPPGGGGLEDIVVTARRQAENLQRTPVSVSAISAKTLEHANITQIDKITQLILISVSSRLQASSGADFGLHPRHWVERAAADRSTHRSASISTASMSGAAMPRTSAWSTCSASRCCAGHRARSSGT